jgi:hypothetical protein
MTNMDAATDWVVDGGQSVLDFDGSNDTVNAGTSPSLSTPDEMTFSLWVRPVLAVGVDVVAANSNIGVTEVQWALEFNRTANKFSILANAATVALTSTTAITQGDWYHVMFTRSGAIGSWVYRFFLNGRQDGEATTTQNPGNHSTVALGSYGAFDTSFTFRGMIDDARLYTRPLAISEGVLLASSRGIAYTPRRRRKAYFLGPSFNAAWARGSNVLLQPCGVS